MAEPRHWVNAERTVLVTQHPNGTMSIAVRDHPDAIWGPPIDVEEE